MSSSARFAFPRGRVKRRELIAKLTRQGVLFLPHPQKLSTGRPDFYTDIPLFAQHFRRLAARAP
jgi:hypothetical protein